MKIPEQAEELINEIKERFSSPFFGSFFIAWIFINWYIPVSLIFYDQKELTNDHFHSYREVINSQINLNRNFWLPLICALGYVIVSPLLKAVIHIYQAKVGVFSKDKIIDIENQAKTYETRLNAKDEQIMTANFQIVTLQNKSTELSEEIGKLKADIINKNKEIENVGESYEALKRDNQGLNYYKDLQSISGNWKVNIYNGTKYINETWQIAAEGTIRTDKHEQYDIHNYIAHGSKIVFQIDKLDFDDGKKRIFFLEALSDGNILSGKDLENKNIRLEKMVQKWVSVIET